jgi:Protein of unknown function (DUF2817)
MMSLATWISLLLVLICMLWAFLLPYFTSIQTCSKDLVVPIPWIFFPANEPRSVPPSVLSLSTCDVFSDTYKEARQRFRNAVQALGTNVTLESLTVVPQSSASASNEDVNHSSYTMDVAVIPGSCPGLVVHISGTHGVEGYAGSAIQIAFLQGLARQRTEPLLDQGSDNGLYCSTIVLVHVFNPYGMAHYRRVNENNVDLNRNGLVSNLQWDKVLHRKHFNTLPYVTIVGQHLLPQVGPYAIPPNVFHRFFDSLWLEQNVFSWLRMLRAVYRFGIPKIKAALVGGQYHDPNGLFYGGGAHNHDPHHRTEASLRLLREWMNLFLTQRSSEEECVTWIDVHTGLGPMGMDTLLFGSSMDSPDANDIEQWFPSSLVPSVANTTKETTAANAVAQGYEQVVGLTIDYYYSTFWKDRYDGRKNSSKHLFMVQEFGTVPSPITGHALVVEHVANQRHRRLDPITFVSELHQISNLHSKNTLGRAFYPQNAKWRRDVLQRGVLCLQQAIRRSSFYSSSGKSTFDLDDVVAGKDDSLLLNHGNDHDDAKEEL